MNDSLRHNSLFPAIWVCLALAPHAGVAESVSRDCVLTAHSIAAIGASAEGLITDIRVDRGDVVREGDVLVQFESVSDEIRLALARIRAEDQVGVQQAEASARAARLRLDRVTTLRRQSLARAGEVEEATLALETAQLDREAAVRDRRIAAEELREAEAAVARRQVRAPFDGVVLSRAVSKGERYVLESGLLTLARIDPLYVEAYTPYGEVAGLEPGQPLTVQLEDGSRHPVTLDVIDPVLDAATGTLGLRAVLPNPDRRLRAGQTCQLLRD